MSSCGHVPIPALSQPSRGACIIIMYFIGFSLLSPVSRSRRRFLDIAREKFFDAKARSALDRLAQVLGRDAGVFHVAEQRERERLAIDDGLRDAVDVFERHGVDVMNDFVGGVLAAEV